MKKVTSDFHFLGPRTYVQGSTLFDGALEAMKIWGKINPAKVEIDCRSIIEEQAEFELLGSGANLKEYDSVFKFFNQHEITLVGLRRTGLKNLARIPYDEEGLVKESFLSEDKKTIHFLWRRELPMLKVLIALFKKMLLETQPNEGFGKWIFYKADLDLIPFREHEEAKLAVSLKMMIGGSNAKANITLNEKEVGKIYFNRQKL